MRDSLHTDHVLLHLARRPHNLAVLSLLGDEKHTRKGRHGVTNAPVVFNAYNKMIPTRPAFTLLVITAAMAKTPGEQNND